MVLKIAGKGERQSFADLQSTAQSDGFAMTARAIENLERVVTHPDVKNFAIKMKDKTGQTVGLSDLAVQAVQDIYQNQNEENYNIMMNSLDKIFPAFDPDATRNTRILEKTGWKSNVIQQAGEKKSKFSFNIMKKASQELEKQKESPDPYQHSRDLMSGVKAALQTAKSVIKTQKYQPHIGKKSKPEIRINTDLSANKKNKLGLSA